MFKCSEQTNTDSPISRTEVAVRTTGVERRLYDTLPEYWVITAKPQRILAARSNKLQQNPKPTEADKRASCRA